MCRLYKGLDENHDGKVSSAELKTLLLGIQVQADGEVSDDLIENTMNQLDISGDDSIQEDEFVRILTKWLQEARNSLSKNDYNPLSFFIKPAMVTFSFLKRYKYFSLKTGTLWKT